MGQFHDRIKRSVRIPGGRNFRYSGGSFLFDHHPGNTASIVSDFPSFVDAWIFPRCVFTMAFAIARPIP